jgi:hypothetical protein
LITEMQAIAEAMPAAGSEGYQPPTAEQLTAWGRLIGAIASGDIAQACEWVQSFPYQIYQFTDLPENSERYWLIKENLPIRFGWGVYVFRESGFTPVVIEAPHPIADWYTEIEAVVFFRKVRAKALLVAGAHRCANAAFSTCAGTTVACGDTIEPYRVSDVAHETASPFQIAHMALAACGNGVTVVQLHGNGLQACPDIFISNGSTFPGRIASKLYEAAANRCQIAGYSVDLADGEAGECPFTAGGAQAITNGCGLTAPPDACTDFAPRPSGAEQYIAIEQSVAVRKDFDCLVEAMVEAFAP